MLIIAELSRNLLDSCDEYVETRKPHNESGFSKVFYDIPIYLSFYKFDLATYEDVNTQIRNPFFIKHIVHNLYAVAFSIRRKYAVIFNSRLFTAICIH